MKNKVMKAFLSLTSIIYICILIKIILLKYHSISDIFVVNTESFRSYNIIPLKTLSDFNIFGDNLLRNISNMFGNMLVFIPFGLLLPNIFSKIKKDYLLVLISALCLSSTFEILQYTLYLGTADVDDIILNTSGAMVGFLAYRLILKVAKHMPLRANYITLGLVFVMAIPAFYIAKAEFGTLLGIKKMESEYIGQENLPSRDIDDSGTIVNIKDSTVEYKEGIISTSNVENEFLKNKTIKISKDTKIFKMNSSETKSKVTIEYTPLKNLDNIKKDSNIKVWLKENTDVAEAIVISDPIDMTGVSVQTNSKDDDISGSILEMKDNNIVLSLAITQEKEDGSTMSVSGSGESAIKVNVKLKDTTKYTKRIVKGGSSSDKPSSIADLKVDSLIDITGIKDGDSFIADSIIIYEFVK